MWEMQQLRRRADAVDVDLTSHPPAAGGDDVAIVVCSGLDERDAAMFEGRAA